MSGAKEYCPSAATPGQQMELDGFCEPNNSNSEYNTNRGLISRYLLPGHQNAITLKTLESWTGLDQRTIRRMIGEERQRKIPIVADNRTGYYLAETQLEKDICVRSMLHRSNEIRKAAEAIDRAELWKG